MVWLWAALGIVLALFAFHTYVALKYVRYIVYVFQVRPIFKVHQGVPVEDAECVSFTTADGLTLRGCYLPARMPRKGVILFGPEYGANCWSCTTYCGFLRQHGYDIFSFDVRGQGDSPIQAGYEPLQWVTNYEVADFEAALAYLKSRPDADPNGVGFMGISKGGGAGVIAASANPFVRCLVTDGIFATENTMVPYMRRWVYIYSPKILEPFIRVTPAFYFRLVARIALKRLSRERSCDFPHLEKVINKLSPRPLFMIHGGADTYITPDMARALFERARSPKDFWVVDKAKHNQSVHVANGEYQRRILEFFDKNLVIKGQPVATPIAATTALQ